MKNREELLERLSTIRDESTIAGTDAERPHKEADKLLLDYINDEEITKAFNAIYKWYA